MRSGRSSSPEKISHQQNGLLIGFHFKESMCPAVELKDQKECQGHQIWKPRQAPKNTKHHKKDVAKLKGSTKIIDVPWTVFAIILCMFKAPLKENLTSTYGNNTATVLEAYRTVYHGVKEKPDDLDAWKKQMILTMVLFTPLAISKGQGSKSAIMNKHAQWVIQGNWDNFTLDYFAKVPEDERQQRVARLPDQFESEEKKEKDKRHSRTEYLLLHRRWKDAYNVLKDKQTILHVSDDEYNNILKSFPGVREDDRLSDILEEIDYAENLDELEVFANSSITATGEMYRKLVQAAPLGVADGPTRMTYEHLRYLNAFSTYKTIPKLQEVVFDLLADSCNKMVRGMNAARSVHFLCKLKSIDIRQKGDN